jgi:CheY-like chemotaxis protein
MILVYADQPLSDSMRERMRDTAATFRIVDGPERLREEIGEVLNPPIFITRAVRRTAAKAGPEELAMLECKRVLVVDDDLRNIFALTSLLERYKMDVAFADNGQAAISMLQAEPEFDIVLMDIMMPGMDGFQAMREIRTLDKFKVLPIIALTARAMKGDREKCIEAGASDYVPKPVAPDQLLSVLCAWLQQDPEPMEQGEAPQCVSTTEP